jgi:hypothetical protein
MADSSHRNRKFWGCIVLASVVELVSNAPVIGAVYDYVRCSGAMPLMLSGPAAGASEQLVHGCSNSGNNNSGQL